MVCLSFRIIQFSCDFKPMGQISTMFKIKIYEYVIKIDGIVELYLDFLVSVFELTPVVMKLISEIQLKCFFYGTVLPWFVIRAFRRRLLPFFNARCFENVQKLLCRRFNRPRRRIRLIGSSAK